MHTKITIFSTNDIHGRFLGENDAIDFSRLATLKTNTLDSLLIDAGDATQGTPLAIAKMGQYPIEIMNDVGYDILTVGNHEFDNITKDTEKCELDNIIKKFNGTYLAANLMKKNGKNYIADVKNDMDKGSYELRTVAGKNLLFIGIVTPDMSMDIKRMEDFKIGKLDEFASQIKDIISEQKSKTTVDAVIIISHLGIAKNTTTSDMLAEKVSEIDLIIDGHSHDECMRKAENGNAYIVQTGCYGKKFSEITLDFSDDKKLTVSAVLHDNNYLKTNAQDKNVINKLTDLKNQLEKDFGQVWASSSICTLWGGALEEEKPYVLKAVNIARYAETNLGQIVSEAMIENTIIKRNEISAENNAEYIVAGINGGSLRDSIAFDKPIRNYELFTVMPSPLNSVNESGYCVFKITLEELKTILLNSVSSLGYANGKLSCSGGKFLNVAGISFNVVYNENSENKIYISDEITLNRMTDYSKNSQTLSLTSDKNKTILFCTTKYIASGGDGYTIFKDKKPVLSVNTALFQITGEYIYRQTGGSTLMADCVSKNISYSEFNFNKPSEYKILLTDINSARLKNEVVMIRFNKEKTSDVCRFLLSDNEGFIYVTPPDGNSILEIVVLTSINTNIKPDNLYCELYFHTYYMQGKNQLTAYCTKYEKKPYILRKLTTFGHTYISSGKTHYSHYLNYIDHENKNCSFLIYDDEMYVLHFGNNEYFKEDHIEYIDNNNEKKTFSLSFNYKTWGGGKYVGKIV